MIKKIFIIFTFVLILSNIQKVDAITVTEYIEEYDCSITIVAVNDFAKDESNENYYSKTYEIITNNCNLVKFTVPNAVEFPYGCFIANDITGKQQKEFYAGEKRFKIMVPIKESETEFVGIIQAYITFEVEVKQTNEDGTIEYVTIEDTNEQYGYLDNRKSTLKINTIDSETLEGIAGVNVQVKDYNLVLLKQHKSNEDGEILINKIGEGPTAIKVLEIPEEYNIQETEYLIDIGYKENVTYDIKLEHKKGSVSVNNLANSSFEIYNSENKFIGQYSTDEEGKFRIEKINTGKYYINQIKCPEEYELVQNVIFYVEENTECIVNIANRLKEEQTEVEDQLGDPENEEANTNNNLEKPKDEIQKNEDIKIETNDETQETENKEEIKEEVENEKENILKDPIKHNNTENIQKLEEEVEIEEVSNEKSEKNNNKQTNVEVLPRTGDDYFEIKLILIDSVIFIILLVLFLKKKKQTVKNSLLYHKN